MPIGSLDGTAGDDFINDGLFGYVDADGETGMSLEQGLFPGDILNIYGYAGSDVISVGYSFEGSIGEPSIHIYGGDGDDSIDVGEADVQLFGGDGDDTIIAEHLTIDPAQFGITQFYGGNGDDHLSLTLRGSEDSVWVFGGNGADHFDLGADYNYGSWFIVQDFEAGVDTFSWQDYDSTAADFLNGFANLPNFNSVTEYIHPTDPEQSSVIFYFNEPDGTTLSGDNGTAVQLNGVTLAQLENGLNPEDIILPTESHHFSTTLVGTPHSSENGIKERGGFYLGDGVVLTDSRFLDAYDPADIFVQVGSAIPGAEQPASTATSVTALAGSDGSELALLETEDVGAGQTGMIIYANPNDAAGNFSTTVYNRAENGDTAHEYGFTISQDSYQSVTLKNRTNTDDVLLTDGLPEGVYGGGQGSGAYQQLDLDGDGVDEHYYIGALVGPYIAGADQAYAVDPVGDVYYDLAAELKGDHSAEDFARNVLIADMTASDDLVRLDGTFFHEDMFGGDNRDDLRGKGGDDRLFGGDNNDRLAGGNGDDLLEGDDTLDGGAGRDRLRGGKGDDTVDGGINRYGPDCR